MKLDRLLAITMILIQKRRVPAKELAEMFEVSVRTIYRDIEAINQAGIPVVSFPGANGGIGIMENYRLNQHILTQEELASITMALKSVSSSYRDTRAEVVLGKIQGMMDNKQAEAFRAMSEQIYVDFSPWGKDQAQKEKLTRIKQAIQSTRLLSFTYHSAAGTISERVTEPHTLVLKGRKWYLYAYCRSKMAFRLFKLSRIKNPLPDGEQFVRREINLEELPWDKEWHQPEQTVQLQLRFAPQLRTTVEEMFGVDSVEIDEQGYSLISEQYPLDNWLYGFVLSFGPGVEVLQPLSFRTELRRLAEGICKIYADT
ncbi:YafY family transcriptional regulator [Brevibacillus ruminantium]|uniref:YafY family transcriptional regulator n=1 Tax=Brevibacillus ruminantium TaxID=2950604 RepID=A0ABY4WCQ0_9BACL|nr:YafY family protein [Brevibacillus ruminantium]USG64833.1 YafY family transcriptional regulator [Brevibacillus ruminantium]